MLDVRKGLSGILFFVNSNLVTQTGLLNIIFFPTFSDPILCTCSPPLTRFSNNNQCYKELCRNQQWHGSLNNTMYFGTLICPSSTKSLPRLNSFLLTWLLFQSLKKECKQRTTCSSKFFICMIVALASKRPSFFDKKHLSAWHLIFLTASYTDSIKLSMWGDNFYE